MPDQPGRPDRPPRRPVVVRDTTWLTPRYVRVSVGGELADWPEPGPAAHMKIFLPQPNGETTMRTYTVRAFNREAQEVAIDVYLHEGNGPAVRWAERTAPGDALELAGRARSSFSAGEGARTYLFAGDASAMPAIATCLEALPAAASATVVGAVRDPADAIALTSPASLDVRWLHAVGDDAFVAAVAECSAERAWVACEATLMRRVRESLLDSGRFSRETTATRGYWKRGEANHPDHDTGEEDGRG